VIDPKDWLIVGLSILAIVLIVAGLNMIGVL